MADKISKLKAGYSMGHADSHCGICEHYERGKNRCEIVEGRIDPAYWCKYFERRKTKS